MVQNASHPADCSAIWPHLRLVWKGKNRTFTINGSFLRHKITLRGVIYMTTKQTCHISAISKNCMRLVTSQRAITFCKIFFHYSLTNFTFTGWPFPTERSSKSKYFYFQKFTHNLSVYMNFIWCLNSTKFNSKR